MITEKWPFTIEPQVDGTCHLVSELSDMSCNGYPTIEQDVFRPQASFSVVCNGESIVFNKVSSQSKLRGWETAVRFESIQGHTATVYRD